MCQTEAVDGFTPGFVYRLQPPRGLSWCCHSVCYYTAISPISLIIAVYYQLVFNPTANTENTTEQLKHPSSHPLNTSDELFAALGMCCSHSTDWYESILICQAPEVVLVLTFCTTVAVFSKWSRHFSSMFSATLYILLTLPLWWRNPSPWGSTTKPLASHLQGADSPTLTAQNCTFHRVEKGEWAARNGR